MSVSVLNRYSCQVHAPFISLTTSLTFSLLDLYEPKVYAYSLAAGLMSGEGLGGVINALFAVIGIDGSKC